MNDIHKLLLNLQSKSKFTTEHNFKEQLFLDILIKKQNGQIIIGNYSK